ncbi:helicase [Streptomyces daqingensis]|uniref:Helicase n=1 Tax=Streptomyces daqingensis TaxID=1472640 RepID=A0ABQ2LPI8_9ACTN|nr:helicase [Streptomyces daqingensis]
MTQTVTTPSEIARLAQTSAVLLHADPPRLTRIAFWRPDGAPPLPGRDGLQELAVALPAPEGVADSVITVRAVPALALPVGAALPVLTRIRAAAEEAGARGPSGAVFWGAACLLALRLAARGRLLPGLSGASNDAWRFGPLDAADAEQLRGLAAAMPPHAHAVPLPGTSDRPRLPEPESELRAFLDAVADTLPRTPAAEVAAGGAAFAAVPVQHIPQLRDWAADVAAGHDAGIRLSLRIEVDGLPDDAADSATGRHDTAERDDGADVPGDRLTEQTHFSAVLQVHSVTDPAVLCDAAEIWAGTFPNPAAFGPRVQRDTLLTLRRAAAAWDPLTPLLSSPVPDRVPLVEEEIAELLTPSVSAALETAGLRVHWPRQLQRRLTSRAVVSPAAPRDPAGQGPAGSPPRELPTDALFHFDWRLAVGDTELTGPELDALAEAGRPLVRLRGQWVLVDPAAVQRARDRKSRKLTTADALGAVLSGSSEENGEPVEVRASGWLESLRRYLSDPPEPDSGPASQPEALAATLRDYQLRGLDWLERMTSMGLGGCLADDMGLGKTVTLIALHLRRQEQPGTSGPTLVVCPASLLGNWEREIERFAPGTPVRRYHGTDRHLGGLDDGEVVLTTYGTMRLDAGPLTGLPAPGWGLVVADEAQHVKNPFSATARALRTIPGRSRVALTGTPVENNLSELWSVLDWTTPGLLGRLGTFRRRYADAAEGGDPASAERLARLVRPFLLRRHKSDPGIAPELPPKTETDRTVALTSEQAGLYEAVVREGLEEISGSDGDFARRGLVVKLLTSLKQICNHPAQYLKEDAPELAGRSGKLELLDELLGAILAEEDPGGVLVFTQYVRMARLLERHLTSRGVPTRLLHGGTPVKRREDMVRDFQDGAVPVFLLSLKAAGTGLNLTRAAHVVHYDRWWNPAVEDQATDRAYRIGQDRPVQVHRLIAEGTVEDRIDEMLRRKRKLADAVLGSGEAALTELSDSELSDLVALRRSGA